MLVAGTKIRLTDPDRFVAIEDVEEGDMVFSDFLQMGVLVEKVMSRKLTLQEAKAKNIVPHAIEPNTIARGIPHAIVTMSPEAQILLPTPQGYSPTKEQSVVTAKSIGTPILSLNVSDTLTFVILVTATPCYADAAGLLMRTFARSDM